MTHQDCLDFVVLVRRVITSCDTFLITCYGIYFVLKVVKNLISEV